MCRSIEFLYFWLNSTGIVLNFNCPRILTMICPYTGDLNTGGDCRLLVIVWSSRIQIIFVSRKPDPGVKKPRILDPDPQQWCVTLAPDSLHDWSGGRNCIWQDHRMQVSPRLFETLYKKLQFVRKKFIIQKLKIVVRRTQWWSNPARLLLFLIRVYNVDTGAFYLLDVRKFGHLR